MREINDLNEKIRDLRESMNKLIEDKGDLQDAEIIKLSELLDNLINEHDKFEKFPSKKSSI